MKMFRHLALILLAVVLAGFLVAPAHAQPQLPCFGGAPSAPNAPKAQIQPCFYVTDSINNRVLVFSLNTGDFLFHFGSTGTGNGQFKAPVGIVVSPYDGSVFVADSGNSRIQEFDPNGNFIRQFGNSGTGPGRLITPTGVAVDFTDPVDYAVYVADFANNRVVVFDNTGHFLHAFGSSGTGSGQFKGPWGICISVSNALFVTDQNNSRIQMFDTSGNFLAMYGAKGTNPGQLMMPTGITAVMDERDECEDCCNDCGAPSGPVSTSTPMLILVADAANNRVNVYSVQFNSPPNKWIFQFLYKFGSVGTGAGQLSSPLGIFSLTPIFSGSAIPLFLADGNNHRVDIFGPDNSSAFFDEKFGTFGTGPGQFVTPAGIAAPFFD